MEVTFEKNQDGTYKMTLDDESLKTLSKLELLRNEIDCVLLRRMVQGVLTLFEVLSKENPDRN